MLDLDFLHWIVEEGIKAGCSFVEVRYQELERQLVSAENGTLKEFSSRFQSGLGIRVIYEGAWGFASTTFTERKLAEAALKRAISIARASSGKAKPAKIAEAAVARGRVASEYKIDPLEVEPEGKVKLVVEANREAGKLEGVANSYTALGVLRDARAYVNSEGAELLVEVRTVGFLQRSVAKYAGSLELVGDSESRVAGYEFIESGDWVSYAIDVTELARKAVRAKAAKPGTFPVVLDNEVVGLMLHEAFGHASEGDGVEAGSSILKGMVGKRVASELVTVIDEGIIEGGYFIPYDDEGVKKERTIVVEEGVLKGYLHSRATAAELGGQPTGNARAQDYSHTPIVRQTNYYMAPGDWRVEELFEDIRYGYYVRGRGARGGEVNPGLGTFTFRVGPSYVIERGEVSELVRAVTISGYILETLREVDAVARDLKVTTSVFGACGKAGQRVHVGDGGPHVRVKRMVVGGGR